MIKHWTRAGTLKAESRHIVNPAITGATRVCQLTTCGANDYNTGPRDLPVLSEENILKLKFTHVTPWKYYGEEFC